MANHKSAKKRIRQNEKRRLRNRATKSACRTAIKNARKAVEQAIFAQTHGKEDEAKELMSQAQVSRDRAEKLVASAAAKGIYHKNTAKRAIGRISRLVAGNS